MKVLDRMHLCTRSLHVLSRIGLGAIFMMGLAACSGGGGSGVSSSANPLVAAQSKDLQPTDAADTVGVFVALQGQGTTPASGATASLSQEQARVQAQNQFLQELEAAVRRPASGALTGNTCDAASLAARLAVAYKPTSGAAVRIELNACELSLLPTLSSVKGVYADIPLAPTAIASSSTVAQFNQAVIDSFDGQTAWPSYKNNTLQANGANTVIAVLDTGVEDRHPAFSGTGKVLKGACFSTPSAGGIGFCLGGSFDTTSENAGRSCVDKLGDGNDAAALAGGCSHGTSMAATAAMAYANGTVSAGGVAKAAAILPVQVFNGNLSNGIANITANSADLLRGIEWVTTQAAARKAANQTPIVALNMSLGGGSYAAACDNEYIGSLFYAAFANLRSQGVIPVIAAGNSYNTSAISFPACVSNTVSVAAAKLGGGAAASYTNFSDQVKLFAIGGDVSGMYTMPTPCALAASAGYECWKAGAGTSPATAMVSGAVAVLRGLKPTATLSEVEAALLTSTKSVVVGKLSKPLLSASKAATTLLGVGSDTPEPGPGTGPVYSGGGTKPAPGDAYTGQPDSPKPVVEREPANSLRLCIYSEPNYKGSQACGIFSKNEMVSISGYWVVKSVRFFAVDQNWGGNEPLVATPRPKVTFYDTFSRRYRLTAPGVDVFDDTPDLKSPSNSQVRLISFSWAAN